MNSTNINFTDIIYSECFFAFHSLLLDEISRVVHINGSVVFHFIIINISVELVVSPSFVGSFTSLNSSDNSFKINLFRVLFFGGCGESSMNRRNSAGSFNMVVMVFLVVIFVYGGVVNLVGLELDQVFT
jgi:hypothetical protein